MLCGEYAVLLGAPAIVLAVDRKVIVSVRPSEEGNGRLWARPLLDEPLAFDPGSKSFWLDPAQASSKLGMTSRLLPLLIDELSPAAVCAPLDIEIDSRALFDVNAEGDSIKLGLGSSAATSVALFRALTEYFSHPLVHRSLQQQLDELLPLYRKALQSPASGADLAASLFGGVVSVQTHAERLLVQAQHWPDTLQWRAIWTLSAAQTTDFVGRFERWRTKNTDVPPLLERLLKSAQHALLMFEQGDVRAVMHALQSYSTALAAMDSAIQTRFDVQNSSIITPAHQALIEQAAAQELLYKTCGAGGGDLGIAVSDDADRLKAFSDGLSPDHARPLELEIAPTIQAIGGRI